MRLLVVFPVLARALVLLAWLIPFAAGAQSPDEGAAADPMALFGIHVTTGAAAGYVDDRVCARCHAELAESYREVAMARSFYRPRAAPAVEDFDTPFEHAASARIYQMRRDGDHYFFRRHQLDGAGREINVWEVEVDWIMGSGNHSRIYLYRTPLGELYQLPLAWYAADASGGPARWGITPGFDNPWHKGVSRIVQRECMFCHNAYPEVPEGSDVKGQPHLFPTELPEGLGCQRCHGPGGEHVRLSLALGTGGDTGPAPSDPLAGDGEPPLDPIRSSIVNPARLTPARRDDLCNSCHLQPTVVIPGLRHFGRADYSYRAGEPLDEYQVAIDVEEQGNPKAERFEINHHPYRLRQSRCYTESTDTLGCLTCHDPHRKVPAAERAAHYRAACLGCHTVDACSLEAMAETTELGNAMAEVAADDCASCHMPRRRASDVVQVVMTDHWIQRRPDFETLLAPLEEEVPILVDIELIDADPPSGSLAEVYRAVAVERAGGQEESLRHLHRHLPAANVDHPEPWLQLVKGLSRLGLNAEARALATDLRRRYPDEPRVVDLLALSELYLGRKTEGVELLGEAITLQPDRPEGHFNLGRIFLAQGQPGEAEERLLQAIHLRPNFVLAWYFLGQAYQAQGQTEKALDAYHQTLALDPALGRGYVALVDLLLASGQTEEARLWWQHGREHARNPDDLPATLPVAITPPPRGR